MPAVRSAGDISAVTELPRAERSLALLGHRVNASTPSQQAITVEPSGVSSVLVRVWRYEVVPGRETEFERAYSSAGDWARLFARSEGFRGTRLYRDVEAPAAYLTVDLFEDDEAWARFLEAHRGAYEDLDRQCSVLTVSQIELADGEPLRPPPELGGLRSADARSPLFHQREE